MAAAGLAFFVATVGVPLPAGRTKDRSIPFPCMDRPCGCHDAAGCKAHCCCFSSEEKLAWAAEHEVDPTPFVEDAALQRVQVAGGYRGFRVQGFDVRDSYHADCCRSNAVACCSDEASDRRGDCGQTAMSVGPEHPADSSDGLISIAAYRQCNGLQPLWTLLHAALPPPDSIRFEFDFLPTGHVTERSRTLTTVSFSPATPPPRT